MVSMVLGRLTTTTRGMLVGWVALVAALAALAYAGNFATSDDGKRDDLLYLWSSAIAGTIQYALIAAVLYAIARPLAPSVLGLKRPASWPRALGIAAAGLVTVFAIGFLLDPFLKAGDEQGLVPDGWDSSRAAPFVANFVVVALFAPVVEELTFRGLGFAVMRDAYGVLPAILVTGVAFGLAHGLIVALPILACFGVILAVVRAKTESLYPPILLHATFNGLALIVAVTQGSSL
jgi:CAAX protease family protein